MNATNYDIRTHCDKPGCEAYAVRKVNLSCFVDYMAKTVCNAHVRWAEDDLKQYVPDR